ncbi:MAG: hypothetical protein M0Q91_04175 [Methanoregula sp.]|nr:hypothetical protein [Methanoregula sp.]
MILGYRHMNVISSVLLLTALVLIFVYGNTTPIPLILLVVSLACSIRLILHQKEWEEEIRPDERTTKIGADALSYAWWIGISGIILLFWSDGLGIWRPDTQTALGISLLLLFIPATLFLVYLSRKSDSNV